MAESAGIEAVVSDFGGVLTTPLVAVVHGLPGPDRDHDRERSARRCRRRPRPTARTRSSRWSAARSPRSPSSSSSPTASSRCSATGPRCTASKRSTSRRCDPNPPMIELMRELKASGYRMAMLTNNVREWEPLWRSMLPVDEIFETVVDSGFVGCRKPESRIYELTLERIGAAGRGLPLRRRRPGQHRRRPQGRACSAVHFQRQRAGDRRDPRRAGLDRVPAQEVELVGDQTPRGRVRRRCRSGRRRDRCVAHPGSAASRDDRRAWLGDAIGLADADEPGAVQSPSGARAGAASSRARRRVGDQRSSPVERRPAPTSSRPLVDGGGFVSGQRPAGEAGAPGPQRRARRRWRSTRRSGALGARCREGGPG